MYNKILVPLDGSEYSECALTEAKELAKNCHIPRLALMYVVEPINPGMYEVPAQVIDDAFQKGQEFGQKYLDGLTTRLKAEGIEVEPVLTSGRVAEVILDYSREHSVDLIVMSTHGRSGISRWILGSVADKIIRRSSVPVLLVTPSEIKSNEARK